MLPPRPLRPADCSDVQTDLKERTDATAVHIIPTHRHDGIARLSVDPSASGRRTSEARSNDMMTSRTAERHRMDRRRSLRQSGSYAAKATGSRPRRPDALQKDNLSVATADPGNPVLRAGAGRGCRPVAGISSPDGCRAGSGRCRRMPSGARSCPLRRSSGPCRWRSPGAWSWQPHRRRRGRW